MKKEQTILISAKYNHKCTKQINLLSPRLFPETFLNDFQNFFNKKEKNRLIWFNLSQTYGSITRFARFEMFFLEIPLLKNFFPGVVTSLLTGGVLPPHLQLLCNALLLLS